MFSENIFFKQISLRFHGLYLVFIVTHAVDNYNFILANLTRVDLETHWPKLAGG